MLRRKLLTGILVAATISGGVLTAAAQDGGLLGGRGDSNGALSAALDAAANETGLSNGEILAQMADGLTLADIVTAEDGNLQVVIDAAVAALTERVNNAVDNGLLTEARGAQLLENLEASVSDALTDGWMPGGRFGDLGANFGGRFGRGGQDGHGGPRGGRGLFDGEMGFGLHIGRGAGFDMLNGVLEDLNIDAQVLRDEIQSGATVEEAITAAGGDPQEAVTAVLAAANARHDEAVASGRITQEQADQRLADLETRLNDWLTRSPLQARLGVQLVPIAIELAADELGITRQELRQQIADGATLGSILTENGIDQSAFVDTLVERAAARLNVQVVDGDLTQAQADAALAELRQAIEAQLNATPATETGATA
jgi:uncharacterized protein YlaN (UPF0358 family)